MGSPSDVILDRGHFFTRQMYAKVYTLYSARSELRQFFTNMDLYVEHAESSHGKESELIELNVIQEKRKGNLAEVRSTEQFNECGCVVNYMTKSVLVFEENGWRILKEEREKYLKM